mmetsp:Transcript_38772/g.86231  ORF Transcript_38772/g.86231 Transcript_38772/m.86231 type:complete len:248 (-) Transcript_38772:1192-1935(-)
MPCMQYRHSLSCWSGSRSHMLSCTSGSTSHLAGSTIGPAACILLTALRTHQCLGRNSHVDLPLRTHMLRAISRVRLSLVGHCNPPLGATQCPVHGEDDVGQQQHTHNHHHRHKPLLVAGLVVGRLVEDVDAQVDGGPGHQHGQASKVVVQQVPVLAVGGVRGGTDEGSDHLGAGKAHDDDAEHAVRLACVPHHGGVGEVVHGPCKAHDEEHHAGQLHSAVDLEPDVQAEQLGLTQQRPVACKQRTHR